MTSDGEGIRTVKAKAQVASESPQIRSQFNLISLAAAISVVVATGLIAGAGRVEFASPFTTRQAAVRVTFYDGETGEIVDHNAIQLLPLALQGRLGYQVEVYRLPPNFLRATLQSFLAWLSLWLALGLTIWAYQRSLTTNQWFQIGSISGWLMLWRLFQVIGVSCWLWLPNWRSELVVALLDLVQGNPVPHNLAWATMWRGTLWLSMGIATFIHIFAVFRLKFNVPSVPSLFGLLPVYLIARLIYALSSSQWFQ